MGFFNTKKEHSVNATAIRVIDKDSQIPNSLITGAITSLHLNDGQIVENVMESLVAGIGAKAHQMYSYGKRKYTYGVPTGTKITSDTGAVAVENAIEKFIDPSATVVYHQFAPLNNLHVGWMALVDTYGYKSSTNKLDVLSSQKGNPVYLKDMEVVLTQASADKYGVAGVEQWGVPPNSGYTPERITVATTSMIHSAHSVDAAALQDYVRVTYVWQSTSNVVVDGATIPRTVLNTEKINIPFTDLEEDREDDDYFQVMYEHNGNYGYWLYKYGDGSIPELDALFTASSTAAGSFFPFAYFRYSQASEGGKAKENTEAYKTSEKLMDYFGIDYQTMIDNIHENPDIEGVEQAIMMMAVPAKTTNQRERRYLYDFFDRVVAENGDSGSAVVRSNTRSFLNRASRIASAMPPKINYVIKDKRFTMSIGCDSITRTKKAGSVAAVGKYSSAWGSTSITKEETITDSDGNMVINLDTGKAVKVDRVYLIPTHFYRKQLSAAVYEEIAITGMRSSYQIWGGMTTMGIEGTDTEDLLLVPLDYSITRKYSMPAREELYARSLHFIFTSHVITKIKWYQKSAFKIIFIVVAVIVAIITQGASIKATLALWAAMTAVQLAYAILMVLIEYVIYALVAKLFVKLVGAKVAFLAAIVMVVAAFYGYIDAGSMSGCPWAGELMTMSSNLTSAVTTAYSEEVKDIQNEYSAFLKESEVKTKKMEDLQELYDQGNHSHLIPMLIPGETPPEFYQRTVHNTNPGLNAIDAISSYVSIALRLPEPIDTMRYT